MNIVCKNCDAHFKGHYCPNCAQKASTARLRVGNVLHELWHNVTHTDKGILGLISNMFTRPGATIREYIEGKRKKYFNPYTFFLLATALLIYVSGKVFHYEDQLYRINNEYGQYLNKNYNLIVLLSFPFLAGLLKLVFVKRRYNYAEWIAFLVFVFGFINMIQVFIQCLYFPLIGYHYIYHGYTDLLSYLIFIVILVSFIQPKNVLGWLQCVITGLLTYFFVERVAMGAALALWGMPINLVLKMIISY